MPYHQQDLVRYFTFDSFDDLGVKHAIFTRIGGVSPHPWASLNVGGSVGDDPSRVANNRERMLRSLGFSLNSVFDVWQVHGEEVICAESPRKSDSSIQKGDAILTDRSGIVLFMRFADCVPILLCDPIRHAVGMIHVGWRGALNNIIARTIDVLKNKYHSNPMDILAAIGPSICVEHYEIGEDVAEQVKKIFPSHLSDLMPTISGKPHFDLWKTTLLLLEQAGVKTIELAGLCTACDLENWYSYRAEGGITGRFGAIISL